MIITTNLEEAKKLIKSEKKPVIILAQDTNFNRKILEYGKFDVLMSPERYEEPSLKQNNSGLNEIMARIAKKNDVAIGIDIEEIKKAKEKAKKLSQIKQNLEICRHTGTRIYARGSHARELLLSLGASTKQAQQATQSF